MNNTDTSHLSFGCDNRTKQHSRYKRLHYTKDPNNKLLVCKAAKNNHSYPNILQCLCNLLDNIRFVSSNSIWFHVILFLVSRSQLFLRKKIFHLRNACTHYIVGISGLMVPSCLKTKRKAPNDFSYSAKVSGLAVYPKVRKSTTAISGNHDSHCQKWQQSFQKVMTSIF